MDQETQDQFFKLVDHNKKLLAQLEKANNMVNNSIYIMILIGVIIIIMLIRVMGWI